MERTLVNQGTIDWDSGQENPWQVRQRAPISNEGDFNINGSAPFNGDGQDDVFPAFVNFGSLTKTLPTLTEVTGIQFNNLGTVEVNAGTLEFSGGGLHTGTFEAALGTVVHFLGGDQLFDPDLFLTDSHMLQGAGRFVASDGTITIPADSTVFATNFELTGSAVLTGEGVFDAQNFLWSGGRMRTTAGALDEGVTRIRAGEVMTIEGGVVLDDWIIEDHGTIIWAGENVGEILVFSQSAQIVVDAGRFDVVTRGGLIRSAINNVNQLILRNGGILDVEPTDVPGLTTVQIGILNESGILRVNADLDVQATIIQRGGETSVSGATLQSRVIFQQDGGTTTIESLSAKKRLKLGVSWNCDHA
ncbi:MAG: hypothetical protein K2R98_12575 [Gemmataceae bacterium]|nr:hypothetical protein [Gemmataceae bacterium]